jgi:hypothetical protein
MGEVDQDLDALAHDIVGAHTLDAGDKADTASIVLLAWIVKTLRRRQTEMRPWPVHEYFFRWDFRDHPRADGRASPMIKVADVGAGSTTQNFVLEDWEN